MRPVDPICHALYCIPHLRMKVVCYQSDGELAALRHAWNALAAGEPLRSWEWLASWWHHYGPGIRRRGGELLLLAVESPTGELLGLAPWYIVPSLRGRMIRFLGDGDVCTDYLTLLAAPGHEFQVAERLGGWLAAMASLGQRGGQRGVSDNTAAGGPPCRHCWDLIELEAVDAADVRVQALMQTLAQHGILVETQDAARCWRVEFPPTWGAFLAKLSKSHRKQVGRCQRRYLDTGRAVLHRVKTVEELSRGLEILQELHGRRRQALGDAGRFADTRFAGFLAEACGRLLDTGQLRLCWLEIDGEPAAAEMQLAGPHTVYAYQAGVEPRLLEHEPGRLITLATLQGALAEGYAAFDFLRGDEPYKAHWRAESRPQLVWRGVAPRLLTRARFMLWRAARGGRAGAKLLVARWRQLLSVLAATGQAPGRQTAEPDPGSTAVGDDAAVVPSRGGRCAGVPGEQAFCKASGVDAPQASSVSLSGAHSCKVSSGVMSADPRQEVLG